MTRIVTVTSGKGGVGTTHLSVNLALQCARKGLRTCLFDADLGLANVSLLLNLSPARTLADVISGTCHLQDILVASHGIDVIPGSSGLADMAELPPAALRRIGQDFASLTQYDLVIFDTSSGVAKNVLAFVAAAPEVLLVVTPEPTALTDAYAVVKLLRRRHYAGHLRVIVNQVHSERQAQHTYEKFREVVRVYQGLDLPLLGAIPFDKQVAEAGIARSPVSLREPESPSGSALAALAEQLLQTAPEQVSCDPLLAFWSQFIGEELPVETLPEPITAASAEPNPTQAQHAAESDLPTELTERLTRLEVGMAALLEELLAYRESTVTHVASIQEHSIPAEQAVYVDEQRRHGSRRSNDAVAPARFVRNAQRATPIDALQLRRVVGRMLVKAMPVGGSPDEEPVRIAVDQIQLDGGNDYSLRPGRYTRISLHCHHIRKPDSFIEEIFNNCAITGCKVRHLGSHVRYWVTSGRDGCILLDGDDSDRNCVQVYMATGSENLLDIDTAESETVPSLRRLTDGSLPAEATPAQLLGKFPHQRLLVEDAEGESLEIFRLLRRDRSPLLCAFNQASGEPAAGHLREHSP